MNKETKGMLIGFVGILVFSLTLPISKIAVVSFSPYFIAFGRATLAGLVALAYLAYKQDILGLYRYIYDIKISEDKCPYFVTLYGTCTINDQFRNYIKIIENDLQTTIFTNKGVVLVEATSLK